MKDFIIYETKCFVLGGIIVLFWCFIAPIFAKAIDEFSPSLFSFLDGLYYISAFPAVLHVAHPSNIWLGLKYDLLAVCCNGLIYSFLGILFYIPIRDFKSFFIKSKD